MCIKIENRKLHEEALEQDLMLLRMLNEFPRLIRKKARWSFTLVRRNGAQEMAHVFFLFDDEFDDAKSLDGLTFGPSFLKLLGRVWKFYARSPPGARFGIRCRKW